MKQGLLLINLGTPESPTPEAVGEYLNEFLMDPFVIDIPAPFRWILVKRLIVPKRKYESAKAYQTIWTSRGSPLAFHLQDLTDRVRKEIPAGWVVEAGMRYGNPSIRSALERLKNQDVERLTILPLYPQYAESSSRSSLDKVVLEMKKLNWGPQMSIYPSFHDEPHHIRAWVDLMSETIGVEQASSDPTRHILFSYHGLPERHLKKSDPTGSYCLDGGKPKTAESEKRKYDCCDKAMSARCPANRTCYRAQSIETTHLIAKEMGLSPDQWSISFQSRLGRTPWIKPYTDEVIPALAKRGVKSLTVVTPSFVADCLETIEEIGDRAKEMFLAAGGSEFTRIECLNARESWVQAVVAMAMKNPSPSIR